jgi:nicotinamidase-related amidase
MTGQERTQSWHSLISEEEREIYRRAGYQRVYGLGVRPALLIIDVAYGFTGDVAEPILESIAKYHNSCGPMAWASIPHIARLLDRCRRYRVPVAYTHGAETPTTVRTPRLETQIVDEIAPRPGEFVVTKPSASAFLGTPLSGQLVRWGVDTIIHTGCSTSGCVRASVVAAAGHGYKNAVIEECVFDRALTPHLVNLFDMDAKYADVMSIQAIEGYLDSLYAANADAGKASRATCGVRA